LVVAGTPRRRFDPEFRSGAVRIVKETGKPVSTVYRALLLHRSSPRGAKRAVRRLALFLSRKHQRSRTFERGVLKRAPSDLGLISLYGIVAARVGKPWRDRPNADGERRR
jgi:transposase-like protein